MNEPTPQGFPGKYAWRQVDRVDPPKRPPGNRVADFREAGCPYDEATAQEQASRCIQCPNPNCVVACPLETPLVELLAFTAEGRFREAAELLFATNSLPEIASHVCVGGRICESACVLGSKAEPVPIRSITRFLVYYGWKHGLAEPPIEPARNQSVAVIGSGIGGLVTADILSRRGYAITVLDCRAKPGGRVMNGLPGFRMDKELVERRVQLLKERGIRFRMGVTFGQDVKLSDLRREFDAVFLGFGQADPLPLEVPGAGLRGVSQSFPFVCQNALPACTSASAAADNSSLQPLHVRGRQVVVLGGGDTAMDVLRIAIRQGAADALCIYRRDAANMPADTEEYGNAAEEGARFLFLSQPVAVIGNTAGDVTHIRCIRMQLDEPDNIRRRSVKPLPGTEFDVPADVVFVAYGFTAPKLPSSDDFARLSVNERGCLFVDESRMTNFPGVFAGGSIVRGPAPLSDVVRDAREAAAAIDRFLAARRPRGSG